MINGFLQFLKKQKLAINMAKADMLFLLYHLPSFHRALIIARFFVKKSPLKPARRIENYINSHPNSLGALCATTLALSYGVKPPHRLERHLKGDIVAKQAMSQEDFLLGEKLVPDLVSTNSKLDESYLLNLLELNSDMRLYGAEFSEIQNFAAGCEGNLKLSIDWQQTTSEKLFIVFPEEIKAVETLSLAEQQNLSRLFFYMLYRKCYLILDWNSVLCNSKDEVSWLDFSVIRNISKQQQYYAFQNVINEIKPQNAEEFNIKRAIDLLKLYCPAVDIKDITKHYATPLLAEFKTHDENWENKNKSYLHDLKAKDGHLRIEEKSNKIFSRLKSKTPSQIKKTSIYYWGPLLIAAFLLYYFL